MIAPKPAADYYVYAYLRETDRSPYYVGKGRKGRAWDPRGKAAGMPTNTRNIVMLRTGLTEQEAFQWEIFYIRHYGRKDIGTGILQNKSDGGEGASGVIRSDEYRAKMSKLHKGKILSGKTKDKLREARLRQGNPPIAQEARDSVAEKLRGRPKTEEHKAALRGPRGPQPNIAEAAKKRWAPRMEEMKPKVIEMLLAGKTRREIYEETRVSPNKICEWSKGLKLPSRAEKTAEARRKAAEKRRSEMLPKIKALLLEGMPKKAVMRELKVGQALVYEAANSLVESTEPA